MKVFYKQIVNSNKNMHENTGKGLTNNTNDDNMKNALLWLTIL